MWFLHIVYNAGTTDNACPITHNPSPSEDEILFILNEVRNYLSPDVNGWCHNLLYRIIEFFDYF